MQGHDIYIFTGTFYLLFQIKTVSQTDLYILDIPPNISGVFLKQNASLPYDSSIIIKLQ